MRSHTTTQANNTQQRQLLTNRKYVALHASQPDSMVVTKDDEDQSNDSSQISQSTTIILLAFLLFFYIICITLWFIQSRFCSSSRRGPTYLSLLRQRLVHWKGTLFRTNNRSIQYNYDNLPHHYNLDEREYKSWSVVEVASWSRSKLLADTRSIGNHHDNVVVSSYSMNNTDAERYHRSNQQEDDITLQQAIDALIQQQIDGASLDYISLEYMSRWMPFGTAAHLWSQYNALISTYSSQEGSNQGDNTNNFLRAEDDELPSWYSDNHQLHQAGNNNRHHQDLEAQEDSMSSEHVQRLMRDRFGLSLPTLRTEEEDVPANNNAQVASALEMTNRAATIREPQTKKEAASNRSDGNSNSLDDILKAMPPHIRAVAERRPGMVAELLASRRQQQQHILQKQQELIPNHEEHSAGEADEEEVDFDSESASLLRRRMR